MNSQALTSTGEFCAYVVVLFQKKEPQLGR